MDTAYDRALDYTTRGQVQPQYVSQPQYAAPVQYPPQPQAIPQPQYQAREAVMGSCPNCNNPIESDALFCNECGVRLKS